MHGMSVIASFQKNARRVGWLGSGPGLVGRVGSAVRVSESFYIFVRSGFRDTLVCVGSLKLWNPSSGTS